MKKAINLIFPHQLFLDSPLTTNGFEVYLIEEYLFFKQYQFHKQKIAFHRASMKSYQVQLEEKGVTVHYIDSNNELSDIRKIGKLISEEKVSDVHIIDPVDFWLEKRLDIITKDFNLVITSCLYV